MSQPLHVYEQLEIDYMRNKTFLKFKQIISKTTSPVFTKIPDYEARVNRGFGQGGDVAGVIL